MPSLVRAALIGIATGGRASSALTAVTVTNPFRSGLLGNRWTRRLVGIAAAGEFVGDKLPQTPSRLQPEGLLPRLAGGAAAAAVVTSRQGGGRGRTVLAAGFGLLGAAAAGRAGVAWRALAARRFGSDLPGALIEDAWVLAATRYATRG